MNPYAVPYMSPQAGAADPCTEPDAQYRAAGQVYRAPAPAKSYASALLLHLFLSGVGAGDFYMGFKKTAFGKLVLNIAGIGMIVASIVMVGMIIADPSFGPYNAKLPTLDQVRALEGAYRLFHVGCWALGLLVVWALQGSLSGAGFPVGRAATIAVGMTLQAIPFLLLGVFVAELIEAYLSPALIARVFPTNPLASVLTALLAAFVLPVCDCSAVPIFRSLLRKGVPLSAATTLMLASPAINPLVFASTLYAFGSWSLVAARVGLSVIVALTVGLSMLVIPPRALREESLSDTDHGGDACCCEHGCEMPDRSVSGVLAATGRSFGRILPFLLGGVAASTVAQVLWPVSSLLSGLPAAGTLALMMGAGFALSLCSSSDAVIARSFASLAPTGALMGFMVYGPMMDVKNMALLSSQFRGAFVARLFVTVTTVAALVVGGSWWMGVLS